LKKLASKAIQTAATIKNYCFSKGLIQPHEVAIPVISVGNIAAGGSGKTSLVQWLVREIKDVAVLTRGYRSQMEHKSPGLINSQCDPRICGDEPAMLARMKESPLVYVGKNRCASAKMAAEDGAKVLVLDDGMQYRYLKRNFEIVLVTQDDFNGKSFLRENFRSLERADLIVVMGADDKNSVSMLLRDIAHFTKAPVCGVRYRLSPMKGQKVAAFCALGNPQRFFNDLEKAGAEIVAKMVKPDHCAFSKQELAELAREAEVLVCTAKDMVKLQNIDLPVVCAHAELEFTFGKRHIERIVYEVMD